MKTVINQRRKKKNKMKKLQMRKLKMMRRSQKKKMMVVTGTNLKRKIKCLLKRNLNLHVPKNR